MICLLAVMGAIACCWALSAARPPGISRATASTFLARQSGSASPLIGQSGLITPPPGLALIHRDFCQQEIRIAAVLSGDAALLEACESADVYLGIAKQLGFAPADATEDTHGLVRALFKTIVLGISYGLGVRSLAILRHFPR
jgi:hypothetical protein